MKKLLFVAIFVYVICILTSQQYQMYKYNAEIKANNEKIAQQEKETKKLMQIKEKYNSNEYIEKIAREKLGYVKPGEKIYIDVNKNRY